MTLGGDGPILASAREFMHTWCPPIIAFGLGTLGYMCSFSYETYKKTLESILLAESYKEKPPSERPGVQFRSRLKLSIVNGNPRKQIITHSVEGDQMLVERDVFRLHALNEIVVDRGPSQSLSSILLFIDDIYLTEVSGDGLIFSTPTGSSAYNLSAGGPLVHNDVPCIMMTPICPHSLSFRPLTLPSSATVKLAVPENARSSAWIGIDGDYRFELMRGEMLEIEMSLSSVPFVFFEDTNLMDVWTKRLVHLLNWNKRPSQKSLKKHKI